MIRIIFIFAIAIIIAPFAFLQFGAKLELLMLPLVYSLSGSDIPKLQPSDFVAGAEWERQDRADFKDACLHNRLYAFGAPAPSDLPAACDCLDGRLSETMSRADRLMLIYGFRLDRGRVDAVVEAAKKQGVRQRDLNKTRTRIGSALTQCLPPQNAASGSSPPAR